MSDLAAAAAHLRDLHRGPEPLVLANAWDAASARIVEQAGFAAVATSSGAVASALGAPDDDSLGADAAFAAVATIAGAVTVPVTADIEGGYGLAPAALVERLIAAGAVGCNIEDTDHRKGGLIDAEQQADRVRAIKEAGRTAGVDIVVNARVDAFVRQVGSPDEQQADLVRRGRRYLQAGADCVYPIGVADEALIAHLVQEIGGPINVLLRRGVPDLATLGKLGVARVSLGSGLYKLALDAARRAAEALRSGRSDLWDAP